MSCKGIVTDPPSDSFANVLSASSRLAAWRVMEKLLPITADGPKGGAVSLPIRTLEPTGSGDVHDAIQVFLGHAHVRRAVPERLDYLEFAPEGRAIELEGLAAVAVELEIGVELHGCFSMVA